MQMHDALINYDKRHAKVRADNSQVISRSLPATILFDRLFVISLRGFKHYKNNGFSMSLGRDYRLWLEMPIVCRISYGFLGYVAFI